MEPVKIEFRIFADWLDPDIPGLPLRPIEQYEACAPDVEIEKNWVETSQEIYPSKNGFELMVRRFKRPWDEAAIAASKDGILTIYIEDAEDQLHYWGVNYNNLKDWRRGHPSSTGKPTELIELFPVDDGRPAAIVLVAA